MALAKSNPLPPGRYWIEVLGNPERLDGMGGNITTFTNWVKNTGAVIINSELTPARPKAWGDVEPAHLWALFELHNPTPALPIELGFPTIADSSVTTKADTSAPKSSSGVSLPGPMLPSPETVKEGISMLTWVVIGVGALFVVMMVRKNSGPTIRVQVPRRA
jgi:hypothetical protein